MQTAKYTFLKSATFLAALVLSVVFLPAMANAAVCSQSTSPLRNLTGLTSVVITEKTGTNNVQTYTPTSSSLNFGTSDLTTTAVEHYDFYYSDADGTANNNGAYITSKMHRDVSGANAQAGNNIDSMKLVINGQPFYADLVASYQLGASVSSVANASLDKALGAPDGIVSTVGDQDSKITLGFCAAYNTTVNQCNDGLDNDNDGATDYPNDFSCASVTDNDETNPKSACQDGLDNDNDNLTDYPQDPGCSSKQDNDESNTTTSQCSDNLDNDNDGAMDYPNDFSCASATDNDETNPKAACQDNIDNDGDGLTDYPQDTGCSSKQDNDEFNQTTSNLSVSCYANPGSIQANQSVNFVANVSGGTGNYTYSWNGVCSSSSQNCYNSFTNVGTYTANLYVTSGSQTQNTSCQVNVTQQTAQCTNHSYQQCDSVTNSVSWYNSCGQKQDVYQFCNSNQTCQNNACVNIGNQSVLYVTKTVRNITANSGVYSTITTANPLDIVEFRLTVQTTSNQVLNNVMIRDSLPANLLYANLLTLDGAQNGSNITQQLVLGSMSPGQTKIITYRAQVAGAQNFAIGTTTTLNNVATVTATGNYNPATASASVNVNRAGVLGATDVSTGLTNNPWIDSFFLPMMAILAMATLAGWALRKRTARKLDWIGRK